MVNILKTVSLYDIGFLVGDLEEKKMICILSLLFLKSCLKWI